MQIFHDFCVNDKSGCHHCQFPDLVRRWASDSDRENRRGTTQCGLWLRDPQPSHESDQINPYRRDHNDAQ